MPQAKRTVSAALYTDSSVACMLLKGTHTQLQGCRSYSAAKITQQTQHHSCKLAGAYGVLSSFCSYNARLSTYMYYYPVNAACLPLHSAEAM
jgi:hypothetical protein